MASLGMLRIAERERVEAGDRPRPHGEDVAQDAADAGRRALVRLDVARVVVALHLEHHREPVADVDDAGVLARALDHPGRLGRQPAQMHLRGLVGAVLVPHRREDAELGEARRRGRSVEDALVSRRLEAVFGDKLRRDLGLVGNHHVRALLVCPLKQCAGGRQSGESPASGRDFRRGNQLLMGFFRQGDPFASTLPHIIWASWPARSQELLSGPPGLPPSPLLKLSRGKSGYGSRAGHEPSRGLRRQSCSSHWKARYVPPRLGTSRCHPGRCRSAPTARATASISI
jgi:hypothetical protein